MVLPLSINIPYSSKNLRYSQITTWAGQKKDEMVNEAKFDGIQPNKRAGSVGRSVITPKHP